MNADEPCLAMGSSCRSKIYDCIRHCRPTKYLSYSRSRLSVAETARMIPEVYVEKYFQRDSLRTWEEEMRAFNSKIVRANRLHLGPLKKTGKHLLAKSIDHFILLQHGEKLAKVLTTLSDFANRLSLLATEQPMEKEWWFDSVHMIQYKHAIILRLRVRALVSRLFAIAAESLCPVHFRPPKQIVLEHIRNRPDGEHLYFAIRKVTAAFRLFVRPQRQNTGKAKCLRFARGSGSRRANKWHP